MIPISVLKSIFREICGNLLDKIYTILLTSSLFHQLYGCVVCTKMHSKIQKPPIKLIFQKVYTL